MGERIRNSACSGRSVALSIAFTTAAFCASQAAAQSRSPAGDSGARGLAGTVVQYEEAPSRSVIYLEQGGGLTTGVGSPVPRAAATAAAPAKAATPQTAAKAAKAPAERITNIGASPLRAPQRQAAAAEGAAVRR